MVKSIFDLEKRTNLKKECLKIEKYLNKEQFCTLNYLSPHYTFWDMIDSFIEFYHLDIRQLILRSTLIYMSFLLK